MNTAMTQSSLRRVFDQATREVTKKAAGISLYEDEWAEAPAGNLCTVYARFDRGFHTGLSLCAEESLFTRLTQYMMRGKEVTAQDVEDFTKEYFNVLCGQIACQMFRATRVASRFGIPAFYRGRYLPVGQREHLVLSYTSDGKENAQLTHHTLSA